MDYKDLKVYKGTKTECDYCHRAFGQGEAIHVDAKANLVFCYGDDDDQSEQCMLQYMYIVSQGPVFAEPMRFGKASTDPLVQRPPRRPRIDDDGPRFVTIASATSGPRSRQPSVFRLAWEGFKNWFAAV